MQNIPSIRVRNWSREILSERTKSVKPISQFRWPLSDGEYANIQVSRTEFPFQDYLNKEPVFANKYLGDMVMPNQCILFIDFFTDKEVNETAAALEKKWKKDHEKWVENKNAWLMTAWRKRGERRLVYPFLEPVLDEIVIPPKCMVLHVFADFKQIFNNEEEFEESFVDDIAEFLRIYHIPFYAFYKRQTVRTQETSHYNTYVKKQ